MKNIHILPTNQKSKIFFNHNKGFEKYQFSKEPFVNGLTNTSNQNIYITSDEEIKDGDWILEISDNSIFTIQIQPNTNLSKYKKIILTTDFRPAPDVQKIDDEFLEWFVKNPSCEEVVVIYEPKNFFDVKKGWEYKIIIPKEEPNIIDQWLEKNGNPEITKQVDEEAKKLQKQHLIDMMKSDEELGLYEQTKCYCGHTTTCDCGPEQEILLEDIFNDDKKENIKKFIDEINNPSQPNDKLKQAFEKYSEYLEDFENKDTYEHGFKDGAKCQQEISYSEEEVIAFGEFIFKHSLLTHTRGVKSLFEQFKEK